MSVLRADIDIKGQGARYILDDAKIVNLYKQGQTSKQIALLLKVSIPTIKRRLRQYSVKKDTKYTLDQHIFYTFTPESCYWAGFLAADAWVGSNHKKKKIYVELAVKDIAHLYKMCIFLKRQKDAVKLKTITKNNNIYRECVLEVGNKQIVYDLVNNFNIVQAKSFILKPPHKMPKELIKYFIRGYFDGDGHIGIHNDLIVFNIVSGSKNLLEWIMQIINEEINIKLKMYKKSNVHYIQTSGTKAQSIFNWLYKDSTQETRLDRKYERYLIYKEIGE